MSDSQRQSEQQHANSHAPGEVKQEQQVSSPNVQAQETAAPVLDQLARAPLPRGAQPEKEVCDWIQEPPILWGDFLAYLRQATYFHVAQKFEILELVGWESVNRYTVKDEAGRKLFYASEESDCCARQWCACARPLSLTIRDNAGFQVMVCERPLYCHCLCGAWYPDTMTVTAPSGRLLGTVEKEFSIFYPRFKINDASGATVLKIKGPLWTISCCDSVVFQLRDTSGASVGSITKKWSGLARECLTDADRFSLELVQELEPAIKAVCLGALFLMDYEYFEDVSIKALVLCDRLA